MNFKNWAGSGGLIIVWSDAVHKAVVKEQYVAFSDEDCRYTVYAKGKSGEKVSPVERAVYGGSPVLVYNAGRLPPVDPDLTRLPCSFIWALFPPPQFVLNCSANVLINMEDLESVAPEAASAEGWVDAIITANREAEEAF